MSGSEFGVERLMDRCVERPSGPPPDARAVVRSFGTEHVRSPFDRSSGRLASEAVAAQSLVENVRLAALCGLLRCEIAEDPKGNRRRRSMRRMPRELASGSSEKWRRPVSTGVCIPGSGPAADHDDRRASPPCQAYCVRDCVPERKEVESCHVGITSACPTGWLRSPKHGDRAVASLSLGPWGDGPSPLVATPQLIDPRPPVTARAHRPRFLRRRRPGVRARRASRPVPSRGAAAA